MTIVIAFTTYTGKNIMSSNSNSTKLLGRRRLCSTTTECVAWNTAAKKPKIVSNGGQSSSPIETILQVEKRMSRELSLLKFPPPVTHVYNPLTYAWDAHEWYVRKYAKIGVRVILVGMNPGPWGMAQTGVPFGEVSAVRDFMGMPRDVKIGKPEQENPARPIGGLQCTRSEVSGRRLWREWAETHYSDAESFFSHFYVHNYCPLMFLEASGRNRTPVQLTAADRAAVESSCNTALRSVVRALRPDAVCGIGVYAKEKCIKSLALEIDAGLRVGTILHPSPASPAANKGWVKNATTQLDALLEIKIGAKDWRRIL